MKYSQEKRITEVYSDLFEKIGAIVRSQKVKGQDGREYSYPLGISIYTTNYDDVLETYWRGIESINNLWKATNDILTLQLDRREADKLNLIKLHGSLDWFGLNDGTIVKLDKYRQTYGKRPVRSEFMLYPIQQKDLYLYPWFNLFYRFKDDLERRKTWLVIGYRFNDEFIRNMILEAMDRHGHKLILINPDADRIVDEKFSRYRDDIIKVDGRFGIKRTTLRIVSELNQN